MIKSRKQKGTTASRKRLREDEEQDPGHQTNISTTTEEKNSNNHDDDSETLQPPLKRMTQKPSSSLHFHTTSKSSKKNSADDDNDSEDLQQQQQVPTSDFHQASRDMRCATDQLVTSTNDLLMSDDEANNNKNNKNKNKGPKKPSANVRFNTQMDHQPGICKDYYETGFCGYGDNCVFAHIREEWKSGWKQDKEWEQLQKKKKQKQVAEDGGENDSSDKKNNEKDDDGLPHACFICRQPFVDPVVTVCKHYFCESCALKRFNGGKNPKCAACGAQTNGQFNTARDIIQKLKKLQQTTVK